MNQLDFTFGKQPWQMTLAEFADSVLLNIPRGHAWVGPFEFEFSYETRDKQRDAYIRRAYKWAVIRARQAGEG